MRYINKINLILIALLLLFLTGCSNNDVYSYKINESNLIVIIDNVEYDIGEVDLEGANTNINDAYEFYKSLYPNYIGTRKQFKDDVIKNRLDCGEALLTVIYDINGNQKEDYFYRGDTLTFPNVSSKDYIIEGWKYNGVEVDESFIVEDDMTIEAIILNYLNITVRVQGSGTAKVNKKVAVKGEELKLIYTPDIGYKFSHIIYNGKKVILSDDNSFLVTDNNDIDITAVFEFDELTMPIMSIELETSLNKVNQEDYVNAKMSISNTDEKYEFTDLDFHFRGRGNWSWDKEKKGYRIKFDSKQNLFGNCESKHWAIIASYIDVTLLRNKMSFEMVDVLDEIYYVSSCVNLEVFINGEYRGVYSLVELPRAEKDKMNIDESYTYVDTGYIIELDAYAIKDWQNKPTHAIEGIDYFKIDGVKYPFSVKTPDPDDYVDIETHKEQVAFISDYFKKMFKAVFDHNFNEFIKYADVNSFVDMYILNEIIKSTDVGWQSFYFVKEKEGKVYLTAPWDLEFSSGLNRGDQNYTGMYASEMFDKNLVTKTSSELFINLMRIKEFKELVCIRFKEVKEKLIENINKSLDNALLYEDSYNRNYEKFKLLGTQISIESADIYKLKTWREHVEYLRNWMINRINWLDKYWSN